MLAIAAVMAIAYVFTLLLFFVARSPQTSKLKYKAIFSLLLVGNHANLSSIDKRQHRIEEWNGLIHRHTHTHTFAFQWHWLFKKYCSKQKSDLTLARMIQLLKNFSILMNWILILDIKISVESFVAKKNMWHEHNVRAQVEVNNINNINSNNKKW